MFRKEKEIIFFPKITNNYINKIRHVCILAYYSCFLKAKRIFKSIHSDIHLHNNNYIVHFFGYLEYRDYLFVKKRHRVKFSFSNELS